MNLIYRFVSAIGGIDVFGMISICLFVAVFIGVLIWAFTRRTEFLDNMSSLPLEDGEKISNRKESL
jgi:hypothetical protein